MSTYTIAVVGGLVTDLITRTERLPDRGETLTSIDFGTHHGGKGANSAVAAYRLSHTNPKGSRSSGKKHPGDVEIQVHMVGAVGDDDFGPPLKQKLTDCGVNAERIRLVEGKPTGVGVVTVEADTGQNRILFYPGANHSLLPSHFENLESLASGIKPDLVISQLELQRETVEQVIETAHREGIDFLLNPAPASYMLPGIYPMITHLVVNETEAKMLTPSKAADISNSNEWGPITEYFLRLGVKNVVVTLGAEGAYYANDKDSGPVKAEEDCTVFDTTGAGCVSLFVYNLSIQKCNPPCEDADAWTIGTHLWARMR